MSDELKPCPFCGGNKIGIWDTGYYCETCMPDVPKLVWNTRPLEDTLQTEIDKLCAELKLNSIQISIGNDSIMSLQKRIDELTTKIENLHNVISKQQLKIEHQRENIGTLLQLYTSGKRSKAHKKLREKYRALKARMEAA